MTKIISFWRFVVSLGWAKSGTWANTTKSGEQRVYLVSMHILKRADTKALSIIIGPAAIIIGVINP